MYAHTNIIFINNPPKSRQVSNSIRLMWIYRIFHFIDKHSYLGKWRKTLWLDTVFTLMN